MTKNPGREGAQTTDRQQMLREVLGYLNFSSGSPDAKFQKNLNEVFRGFADRADATDLKSTLLQSLSAMEGEAAFADSQQAQQVIELTLTEVIPAYREWHADLLFHLPDDDFEHPFFVARLFEAVLKQGAPWGERDRVVSGVLAQINNFTGYRPKAILEDGRLAVPYDHEAFCPVPLFLKNAGVATGPYETLIRRTIEFFEGTPAELMTDSWFDLNRMDELGLDMRSHDHGHPVNKRTNYMFGEWDPHIIDTKGFYRRFVLRKIILDALIAWMEDNPELPEEERLYDASAVLCGTMLMASSISGCGPETYDSSVSLTSLLPRVARQRDAFYARLLQDASGSRAKRLRLQAKQTQQPFGHVRQKLNMYLAQYGARQVQHRHIAWLFARMGYEEASRNEAVIIPTLSTRIESEMHCRLTSARRDVDTGNLHNASKHLLEIESLLERGIHCGALIDPWNILGFQGQFPLFSAREDAVPDNRVETMLELMERLFGVFSSALSEAAAQGEDKLLEELSLRFETLADRWDRYATTVVEDLPSVQGRETYESARHVSEALSEWSHAGESAGDISFWRQHVNRFESAKSYALVVEALLKKRDQIASMGLLMQWLSEAETVGLESGPYSIHPLLIDWMNVAIEAGGDLSSVRRMFDYLEANAGEFWQVPQLGSFTDRSDKSENRSRSNDEESELVDGDSFDEFSEEEDDLFGAAYDDVTFRDSADDGFDGATMDQGYNPGNTEFEILHRQLEPRMKFLNTLAGLWQLAAGADVAQAKAAQDAADAEAHRVWLDRLKSLQTDLRQLMDDVWSYEISTSAGDLDSNVEYDIQLQSKFMLLHTVITTSVNCRHAARLLRCTTTGIALKELRGAESLVFEVCRGLLQQDVDSVRAKLPDLIQQLLRQPLLYVPLENGGHPAAILKARSLQRLMRFLLTHLPSLGLLQETRQLLQAAYSMERSSRPGGLAVTEFDRLFRTALRSSLECTIRASKQWRSKKFTDEELVELLREIVDSYSHLWTIHSSTMRLSRVDELRDEELAEEVSEFIEKYGGELFHARMLTLGNIRAILHNGVDMFIAHLNNNEDPLHPSPLLADLETGEIDEDDAIDFLELIYEAIVDKFDRFLEYNTTTTQSDYGEKFFCLLDFLRVESAYERDAWNLTPERITHEMLTRAGRVDAAMLWEQQLQQETRETADQHIELLQDMERVYGVRLPSIRDHLEERFVKPLAVNRMLALVPQAVKEGQREGEEPKAFPILQGEIRSYLNSTFGSGIDIPGWLYSLEKELGQIDALGEFGRTYPEEITIEIPATHIDLRQMRRQIKLLGEPLTKPQPQRRKPGSRKSGPRKPSE